MTTKLKTKWKDIAIRAGKTFIQAFLGAITIDQSFGRDMVLSAVAAGVSAVMNVIIVALGEDYY